MNRMSAVGSKNFVAAGNADYFNMAPDDEILSPQQLSAWLQIPVSTVRELCRSRSQKRDGALALPCFHVGKRIRFNKTAVLTWLTKLEAQRQRN
jgi:helix-turn-helix protein